MRSSIRELAELVRADNLLLDGEVGCQPSLRLLFVACELVEMLRSEEFGSLRLVVEGGRAVLTFSTEWGVDGVPVNADLSLRRVLDTPSVSVDVVGKPGGFVL